MELLCQKCVVRPCSGTLPIKKLTHFRFYTVAQCWTWTPWRQLKATTQGVYTERRSTTRRQQYLVLATKKWRARHHPKARRAVIKCPLLNTEIEEEVIHLTNITTQMVVGPQSTKCQSLPQTHTWPTMVTKMETHVLDLCLPMATKCLVFLQKKKTKSWIEDIGGQRQNLFSVV